MYLVDTSVWIEVFKKRSPLNIESVVPFEEIVTCLPVVREVLQGFDDESAFRIARDAMLALPTVESPLRMEVFEDAVSLFRNARRMGLTVRSGVDCVIAACAKRNDLIVLHCDRDFDALSKAAPLKVLNIHRS